MTDQANLFGRGIAYPPAATSTGGFLLREGSDLLWDSVESIIDTYEGTCPMDPHYGVGVGPYDSLRNVNAFAYRIGQAIARSEPRITDIEIAIVSIDKATNTLSLRITITPATTRVPESRVFPFFGL